MAAPMTVLLFVIVAYVCLAFATVFATFDLWRGVWACAGLCAWAAVALFFTPDLVGWMTHIVDYLMEGMKP